MPIDQLRVEAQERVDLQDFQYLAESPVRQAGHVVENFLVNPDGQRAWILSGFAITNASGKQLTVTKGRAILSRRDGGQIFHGMVTAEGDVSRTVDMNAFTPGVYGVYIRFEFIDGDQASRIKWNATGDGFEYSETIATRKKANWSLRVEASSPGAEWLQIGTADQAAMNGTGTGLVDLRPFYFEGVKSGALFSENWGTGTDRNVNRFTYAVTDLQTFSRAMRQSLEDIKGTGGLREWYQEDVGGMNIGFTGASAVEDRVAVGDATFYLQGATVQPSIFFDTGDSLMYTRSGASGNRWDFGIASAPIVAILNDSAGPALEIGGSSVNRLIYTATGPRWLMDTTDYFQFVRSTNQFDFVTGGVLRAYITSAGEVSANQFLAGQGTPGAGVGFSFTADGAQDTGMFSTADGDLGWYANASRRAEIIAGVNNSALRCRAVTPILNLATPTNQLDLVMRHSRNCVLAVFSGSTSGSASGYNYGSHTKWGAGQYTVYFSQQVNAGISAAVICAYSTNRHASVRLFNDRIDIFIFDNANVLSDDTWSVIVCGHPSTTPTQDL